MGAMLCCVCLSQDSCFLRKICLIRWILVLKNKRSFEGSVSEGDEGQILDVESSWSAIGGGQGHDPIFTRNTMGFVVLRKIFSRVLAACLYLVPMACHALDQSTVEANDPSPLGPVSVCVDPDWEPFERITPNGAYVGIAADLLRLMGKRSNVGLRVTPTRDWEESVALSKTGGCDLLAFLNITPQREQWLIFTEPYFVDANVIVTRDEHDYVSNLAALADTTMALPRGTSIEERVRRDYPNLRLVIVDSEAEAFRLVENRTVAMTLRSLTMAAHTIKKEGWFNLKIAGEIPAYANQMRIGVTGNNQVLRDRLNKAVATLTPQEVNEIINRHVSISVSTRVDYQLVFKIVTGFLVVVGLGTIWMLVLRRNNQALSALGEQLRQDVEARKKVEAALRESEERYRLLIETAQEGIVVVQDGRLVFANPRVSTIIGSPVGELKNMLFIDYVFHEDQESVLHNHRLRLEGRETPERYQLRILRKNGEIAWIETSGTCIEWNGQPAALNFLVDITERKEVEEKIRFMAQHDALTGLPNRALFFDRLNQALALARREQRHLAVMFVDLNDFKPVNDTFGHDRGDILLQAVARRIESLLRSSDTVARIGGDEFVVLLPVVSNLRCVDSVAEKIRHAVCQPFDLGNAVVTISASVGSAVFPDHGADAVILCQAADHNMYRDKAQSKAAQ